jgi:hypothetical protein
MSALCSKKKPADAAWPPLGVTYAITGTREATIFELISRVDSTSPPGVFKRSSTAAAFSRAALIECAADDFDGDRMTIPSTFNRDHAGRGQQRQPQRSRQNGQEPQAPHN